MSKVVCIEEWALERLRASTSVLIGEESFYSEGNSGVFPLFELLFSGLIDKKRANGGKLIAEEFFVMAGASLLLTYQILGSNIVGSQKTEKLYKDISELARGIDVGLAEDFFRLLDDAVYSRTLEQAVAACIDQMEAARREGSLKYSEEITEDHCR